MYDELVELDFCCPDCHCTQWSPAGDEQYSCPRCGYFLQLEKDDTKMSDNKNQVLVITPGDIGFASHQESEAAKALAHQMFAFVDLIHNQVPELYRHEAITLAVAVLKGISHGAIDDPEAIAELKRAAGQMIQARDE